MDEWLALVMEQARAYAADTLAGEDATFVDLDTVDFAVWLIHNRGFVNGLEAMRNGWDKS